MIKLKRQSLIFSYLHRLSGFIIVQFSVFFKTWGRSFEWCYGLRHSEVLRLHRKVKLSVPPTPAGATLAKQTSRTEGVLIVSQGTLSFQNKKHFFRSAFCFGTDTQNGTGLKTWFSQSTYCKSLYICFFLLCNFFIISLQVFMQYVKSKFIFLFFPL